MPVDRSQVIAKLTMDDLGRRVGGVAAPTADAFEKHVRRRVEPQPTEWYPHFLRRPANGLPLAGPCEDRIGDDRVAGGERRRRVRAESGIDALVHRSEEHTSELQSLMRISYAVFCLK